MTRKTASTPHCRTLKPRCPIRGSWIGFLSLLAVFLFSSKHTDAFALETEAGPVENGTNASANGKRPPTVKITAGKKTVIGRLVEYNSYHALILRRDGRMVEFPRHKIDKLQKVSGFTPYTSGKLQEHYRKMFGRNYEVTRTRNYVVVHPPGMSQQWAHPFDELYNRFQYYFSVRGYTLAQPEFPMVVVVFNSRSEFNKVAGKDGVNNPNSYAGYYSAESNWIVTYKNSGRTSGSWEENETLIHEALHQYAFNHGIHQRWAPTPQWCAEGLASMFEARGINNARQYNSEKEKLNPTYVRLLKQAIDGKQLEGQVKRLVASDRVFQENMALGYSLSWGLAFYLAETRPSQFNAFLQTIAARDRSRNYTASDRLADFGQSFGTNFEMIEAHFQRWVKGLD